MACGLTSTSHYLSQCKHPINEVLWHSFHGNCTANAQPTILYDVFENCTFKNYCYIPQGQWVNTLSSPTQPWLWCQGTLVFRHHAALPRYLYLPGASLLDLFLNYHYNICKLHGSSVVGAWTTICYDLVARKRITAKRISQCTLITNKKSWDWPRHRHSARD